MIYDACVVSRDRVFAQFVRLTLSEKLDSVTVAEGAHLPVARRYVFDLDSFTPESYPAGEILCLSRKQSCPPNFPYLFASRPLRKARLLALFGLIEPERGDGLTPLPERKSVLLAGREIPLSPTEYALFYALWENGEEPISAETLREIVWGKDSPDKNAVNLYIHYLRRKLEPDGVKRILSVRGRGYRLLRGV